MKNFGFSLVLTLFVLSFVGCHSNIKAQKRVLFISKNLSHEYHTTIIKGANRRAISDQIKIEVVGPNSEEDFEFQKLALRSVTESKNFDAVVLEPNHSTKLIPELQILEKAGIPFVIVDTSIQFKDLNLLNDCGFVGTDNVRGGELAAHFFGKHLNGGNVVLIRGLPEHQTSIDRERGFIETIRNTYPSIHIVATLNGRWDGSVALKEFQKLMYTAKGKIDGVFTLNDDMALSIAKIYQRKQHRPLIVGFNGSQQAQTEILQGHLDASVVQIPIEMGARAMNRLIECFTDPRLPRHQSILTPVSIVSATRSLEYASE